MSGSTLNRHAESFYRSLVDRSQGLIGRFLFHLQSLRSNRDTIQRKRSNVGCMYLPLPPVRIQPRYLDEVTWSHLGSYIKRFIYER